MDSHCVRLSASIVFQTFVWFLFGWLDLDGCHFHSGIVLGEGTFTNVMSRSVCMERHQGHPSLWPLNQEHYFPNRIGRGWNLADNTLWELPISRDWWMSHGTAINIIETTNGFWSHCSNVDFQFFMVKATFIMARSQFLTLNITSPTSPFWIVENSMFHVQNAKIAFSMGEWWSTGCFFPIVFRQTHISSYIICL